MEQFGAELRRVQVIYTRGDERAILYSGSASAASAHYETCKQHRLDAGIRRDLDHTDVAHRPRHDRESDFADREPWQTVAGRRWSSRT